MQLTIKKPMTVKEYAAEQHIAQQTVYTKISRNADKLKNGRQYIISIDFVGTKALLTNDV